MVGGWSDGERVEWWWEGGVMVRGVMWEGE